MSGRPQLLRRIAGFGGLPLLSALSPLLALPLLARSISVTEFASVAVGQSIGGVGALVVAAGWNVNGIPLVTRADDEGRQALLATSLGTRLLFSSVTFPVAGVLAALVAEPQHRVLTVTTALCTLFGGFTLAWYAVGIARPGLLGILETVPRVVGSVTGALLVMLTGVVECYALVWAVLGCTPSVVYALRQATVSGGWWRDTFAGAWRQLPNVGTELIAGTYSTGASALVAIAASGTVVALFNAGYRLVSLGAVSLYALAGGLQAWVVGTDDEGYERRLRTALGLHVVLGLLGLTAMVTIGPAVSRLLFGSRYEMGEGVAVALGCFFLLWCLETVTGRYVLAARGRTRALLLTSGAGSALGLVSIPVASSAAGAAGGAAALAGSMGLIVLLQAHAGRQWLRGGK